MLPKINPAETTAWQKLTAHFMMIQATHMSELFEEDPSDSKNFNFR
jgi:glucose-6-phosphate isomerase